MQKPATGHDTMPRRGQLQRGLLFGKPIQQDSQGLGTISDAYVPGNHRSTTGFPGTVIVDTKMSRIADGGELAPVQAIWCLRFMDGKQRKLEAGRTTVKRKQGRVLVAVHAVLHYKTGVCGSHLQPEHGVKQEPLQKYKTGDRQ